MCTEIKTQMLENINDAEKCVLHITFSNLPLEFVDK